MIKEEKNLLIHFQEEPLVLSGFQLEKDPILSYLIERDRIITHSRDNGLSEIVFNNFSGFFEVNGHRYLILPKKLCKICKFCEDPSVKTSLTNCYKCDPLSLDLTRREQIIKNYLNFFNELWCRILRNEVFFEILPFDLYSPVGIRVRSDYSYIPSDFLKFLLIFKYRDIIKSALYQILNFPHRKLVDIDEQVQFFRVKRIDYASLSKMVRSPMSFEFCPHSSCGDLVFHIRDKSFYPKYIIQKTKYESLDTLENRFIKYFINMVIGIIKKVREKYVLPESIIDSINTFLNELLLIQNYSFFRSVGEMVLFPFESQVLLKQMGYREIFMLDQLMRTNKIPGFLSDVDLVLQIKDLATLYEYYTFCQIIEALKKENFRIISIQWEEVINIDKMYSYDYSRIELDRSQTKLIVFYQKEQEIRFPRSEKRYRLRPDFIITTGEGKAREAIIIDAKFRFKEKIETDCSSNIVKYLESQDLPDTVLIACLCYSDRADSENMRNEVEAVLVKFSHIFSEHLRYCGNKVVHVLQCIFRDFLSKKISISSEEKYLGYICCNLSEISAVGGKHDKTI